MPSARAPAEPLRERVRRYFVSIWRYFTEQDPTFGVALPPAIVIAVILFVRSPSRTTSSTSRRRCSRTRTSTASSGVLEAFKRDFWGLLPDRSIGSYRPAPEPDLEGALLRQRSPRSCITSSTSWGTRSTLRSWQVSPSRSLASASSAGSSGAAFLCFAVLTEAVTGVVGIADVLGGLGVLLALGVPTRCAGSLPLGVLAGMTIGLFSKESAIVGVPLVAYAGLVLAPSLHPSRPLRFWYTASALVAAVIALVGYTYLRRRLFPINLPAELATPLPLHEPAYRRALHAFLAWFQQPSLPQDPINNPLVDADLPHRIAGAFRVYFRGLGQVLFPVSLSGDYSFPQEPVPEKLVFPSSVLGGLALVVSPLAGVVLLVVSWVRERRERLSGSFSIAPSRATPPTPSSPSGWCGYRSRISLTRTFRCCSRPCAPNASGTCRAWAPR